MNNQEFNPEEDKKSQENDEINNKKEKGRLGFDLEAQNSYFGKTANKISKFSTGLNSNSFDSLNSSSCSDSVYLSSAVSEISLNINQNEDTSLGINQNKEISLAISNMMGKDFYVSISPKSTIKDLKEIIHETSGVSVESQVLIVGSTELDDYKSVFSYDLSCHSKIRLVLKMNGGYLF